MRKLVSVVVPSYNHAAFLRDCLNSVVAQTYRPIELVIVDDGSTDASKDVIKRFISENSHLSDLTIRSFFRTNHGAQHSINFGVEKSRGELIAILNSDDLYHPQRIEYLVKPILQKKTELSLSLVEFIDEKSQTIEAKDSRCAWYFPQISLRHHAPCLSLTLLSKSIQVTSGNLLFTRSLYEKLGGFRDYHWTHDYDFILRACLSTEPILVSKKLLLYRYHGLNTVNSLHVESARFGQEVRRILEDFFAETMSAYRLKKRMNPFTAAPYMWPASFKNIYYKDCPFSSRFPLFKDISLCNSITMETNKKTGRIDVGNVLRPFLQNHHQAAVTLMSLPYLHSLHLRSFSQVYDPEIKPIKVSRVLPVFFDSNKIGSVVEVKTNFTPTYNVQMLLAGVFRQNRLVAILRFHETRGNAHILRGFSSLGSSDLKSRDLRVCLLDFDRQQIVCRLPEMSSRRVARPIAGQVSARGHIDIVKRFESHTVIEGWGMINRDLPEKIELNLNGKPVEMVPTLYSRPDLFGIFREHQSHAIAGFRFEVPHASETETRGSVAVNLYLRNKKLSLKTRAKEFK